MWQILQCGRGILRSASLASIPMQANDRGRCQEFMRCLVVSSRCGRQTTDTRCEQGVTNHFGTQQTHCSHPKYQDCKTDERHVVAVGQGLVPPDLAPQ